MIQPQLQQLSSRSLPSRRRQVWRGAAGIALMVTAMGALAGSALSTIFATTPGWDGAQSALTPLLALIAAITVYARYRHLPVDPLQALTARALVFTGTAMMLAAVALARPGMAAGALWFMTATTVIVTAMAAGAGVSGEPERRATSFRV